MAFKKHLDNALNNMLKLLSHPEVVKLLGPCRSLPTESILFYSILFYSILFYSILFYSIHLSIFNSN